MARNQELLEKRNKKIFERFIFWRVEERRNKRQALEKMEDEFFLSWRTMHDIIFSKGFKRKRKVLAKQVNLFDIKQ